MVVCLFGQCLNEALLTVCKFCITLVIRVLIVAIVVGPFNGISATTDLRACMSAYPLHPEELTETSDITLLLVIRSDGRR